MADSQIVPPGTITSYPRCIGCGFTVEKQGEVCVECAMKPQFMGKNPKPIGSIVTEPQKEPPYIRHGNFARPLPATDTIAEET